MSQRSFTTVSSRCLQLAFASHVAKYACKVLRKNSRKTLCKSVCKVLREIRTKMSTRGKHIFLILMFGDPGTNQEPELVLVFI